MRASLRRAGFRCIIGARIPPKRQEPGARARLRPSFSLGAVGQLGTAALSFGGKAVFAWIPRRRSKA